MSSLQMRAVGALLPMTGRKKHFRDVRSITADARKSQRRGPATPTKVLRRDAHLSRDVVDGVTVWTVTPKRHIAEAPRGQILYVHGSAYIHPIVSFHWNLIHQLLKRTGATIVVPLYGLAPDHTVDEALILVRKVYETMAARPGPLFLMGDSAGGTIALGLAQQLAQHGLPQPRRIVLYAPWLDATLTNPDVAETAPHDPMLVPSGLRVTARWWAGERDLTDTVLSPLHTDYTDIAPIDIINGTHDVLHPDALVLGRRAREKDWRITVHRFDGGFHVFPAAVFLPESRTALDLTERLLLDARPSSV